MKTHKVFSVSSIPFNVDSLSGQIWNLNIEGISENDNNLQVYTGETSEVTISQIDAELQKLVVENMIESFTIEEGTIEEINWNEEWEKRFKPIQVTGNIIIKPSFKDLTGVEDKMVITIDPKMSFGTGEHETTKLVLQLLEEIYAGYKKVLDIGSGTAVLAIAAVKMGAEKAFAVDNDEWCFENGTENVQTNNVAGQVEIVLGEISSLNEKDFDLILANINKNILKDIAEEIGNKITVGGDLILSGLLDTDETEIKEVYIKKGFRFIQTKRLNEWIALHFKK